MRPLLAADGGDLSGDFRTVPIADIASLGKQTFRNVELTGPARIYRAASGESQGYALVAQAPWMVFGNPSTIGENSGAKR